MVTGADGGVRPDGTVVVPEKTVYGYRSPPPLPVRLPRSAASTWDRTSSVAVVAVGLTPVAERSVDGGVAA